MSDIDSIEMQLWADTWSKAFEMGPECKYSPEEMADTARGMFRDRFRAEPKASNTTWNKLEPLSDETLEFMRKKQIEALSE